MLARVYQPAKNAMQSGVGKSRTWILEFVPAHARRLDPLMGWTSSDDMESQVKLKFDSKEDALAYAKTHGIDVQTAVPHARKPVIRQNGYAENFATNRRSAWTH